jgi:hypothetical protein
VFARTSPSEPFAFAIVEGATIRTSPAGTPMNA